MRGRCTSRLYVFKSKRICSVQEAHDITKRSWVFWSAVMVAAEVVSTVEVYVLGVVFLVRWYKYTEEDVALNPPVCDAQWTITYSASRLWYRWRGHPHDLIWSLSCRCFNQKLTCFDQFDRSVWTALVEACKQLEEEEKLWPEHYLHAFAA